MAEKEQAGKAAAAGKGMTVDIMALASAQGMSANTAAESWLPP